MKQILLMIAVVAGQSVLAADEKPLTKEESAKVIAAAIRKASGKPTGELTKADLEWVTVLYLNMHHQQTLNNHQLTDVKGLEKLAQLKVLQLYDNQITNVKGLENLTRLTKLYLWSNQISESDKQELKEALPDCDICS